MTTSNQNNYLKICIKSKVDKISYCPLPLYYSVLQNTIKELLPNEGLSNIRVYWIDEDGDQIDIDESKAYAIFLEKSERKKIFVETKEKQANKTTFTPTTEARPASAQPSAHQDKASSSEKFEHENIECDACGECPIVGFRYKCVQCPNFDLCMNCEAKMLHKQHAMFRFPVPIDRFHLHRSFFKKMKKGCFMRSDPESEDDSRHHGRHHRRNHCNNGRQNLFSALYTMMNDLAEGTDGPVDEEETTAQSATDNKEQQKTDTKTENKQNQDDTNGNNQQQQQGGWQWQQQQQQQGFQQQQQQPPFDLKIDPNYAKAGIQIMRNFSDMFAKMLDPLGINVEVDIDLKDAKQEKDKEAKTAAPNTSNDSKNASQENSKPEEPTTEKRKDSNDSTAASEISDENANLSEKSSEKSSLNQEQKTVNDQEKKKDSIHDETWTLIDKNIEEKSPSPAPAVDEEGAVGGDKNTEKLQPATNSINYTKLSQDLWQHIKREEKKPEMRAQIVYHEKPHINNAVIAMIAMGFSNEGQWLTHLLESVDGDISQALDLMKPVK